MLSNKDNIIYNTIETWSKLGFDIKPDQVNKPSYRAEDNVQVYSNLQVVSINI